MNIEKVVRVSLILAGPLNLTAATMFLFPSAPIIGLIQLPDNSHPFYQILSAGLVALFGAAYLWLAFQTTILRPLLLLGAVGKLFAGSLAIYLAVAGALAPITGALVAGDLVFATLWLYYLLSNLR